MGSLMAQHTLPVVRVDAREPAIIAKQAVTAIKFGTDSMRATSAVPQKLRNHDVVSLMAGRRAYFPMKNCSSPGAVDPIARTAMEMPPVR